MSLRSVFLTLLASSAFAMSPSVSRAQTAALGLAIVVPALADAYAIAAGGTVGAVAYQTFKTDANGYLDNLSGRVVAGWQILSANGSTLIDGAIDYWTPSPSQPSTWLYSPSAGISYDPTVYSAPGSAPPPSAGNWSWAGSLGSGGCQNMHSISFGPSSLSSLASYIASEATAAKCQSGSGFSTYSVGVIDQSSGSMQFLCSSGSQCNFSLSASGSAGDSSSSPSGSLPAADPASPPMWPGDGHCSLKPAQNGTFSVEPQDPDCFIGGKTGGDLTLPEGVSLSSDGKTIVASNGVSSVSVISNPDGTKQLVDRAPAGTTARTVENVIDVSKPAVAVPGTSAVSGQRSNVYDGVGTQADGTPIPATATAVANAGSSALPVGAATSANQDAQTKDLDAIKEATEKLAEEPVTAVPGMPDIPQLYTRVYPDGFIGVWNLHKAALEQTPLYQLLGKFVPTFGAGQCPSITLPLNFGPMGNFGNPDVSPPCWVWDFVGAMLMLMAIFAARRIIFGG